VETIGIMFIPFNYLIHHSEMSTEGNKKPSNVICDSLALKIAF